MHKNNDHRFAHQLINKYHDSDVSLCVVVKDSKEARLINNELSLYLNSENILELRTRKELMCLLLFYRQK